MLIHYNLGECVVVKLARKLLKCVTGEGREIVIAEKRIDQPQRQILVDNLYSVCPESRQVVRALKRNFKVEAYGWGILENRGWQHPGCSWGSEPVGEW